MNKRQSMLIKRREMNKETKELIKRIERLENKLELTTPKVEWTQIGDLSWSEDLGEMNWNDAIAKAKEIGARIPTRSELIDLFDNHNAKCQKLIEDDPSYFFWSATEVDASNAWYVNLFYGNTNFSSKSTDYQVRCVVTG